MNSDVWRVFTPSWRFFDRVGRRPRVFVRPNADHPWRLAFTAPPRRWFAVFFNAATNLYHADCNLIDRLLDEVQAHPSDPGNLTSYQLLAARVLETEGLREFKITCHGQDVLMSSSS